MQIKVLVLRDPVSEPHKPKRRWLRAGASGAVLASGLAVVTGALAFVSIPDANGSSPSGWCTRLRSSHQPE